MKRVLYLGFLLLLIVGHSAFGQQDDLAFLNGQVVDSETGEGIPLAHVMLIGHDVATITNEEGRFRFQMPLGNYLFQFSHLAFEPCEYQLILRGDTILTYPMKRKIVNMEEVRVFAERIKNLTPELYSHVTDYEVLEDRLILIGHPSKRLQSYLYLANHSGRIIDTLRLDNNGELYKDHLGGIWYCEKEKVWVVNYKRDSLSLNSPLSKARYNDSIVRPILQWDDKTFFQDYFVGERGLKTYFGRPQTDSVWVISSIRDSMLMYLLANRLLDDRARQISDSYFFQIWAAADAGRASGGKAIGASQQTPDGVSSSDKKRQSDYMLATFTEPLIYGTGGTGFVDFTIPLISHITAPIFRLANVLVQIDYYNNSIYFFNKQGFKIHQVSIDFHQIRQAGGILRQIFFPLVDDQHQKVYVWVQRTDHVEVYELDVETGKLAKRINLDGFQNVHNLKIESGSLFFLYNGLYYPFSTRLYRMDL